MIPPTSSDTIAWASIYPGKPSLSQTITDNKVISERIEEYTYLLEKEGSYTLPEIKVAYYNLQSRKWIHRTLLKKEMNIADNPDLYALKTLQDSLNASDKQPLDSGKNPLSIFGLPLKKFSILFAIICIVTIGFVFLLKRVINWFKAHKAGYLISEKYQFKKLIWSIQQQNFNQINSNLYLWLNKLDDKKSIISVSELGALIQNNNLIDSVNELHKIEFRNNKGVRPSFGKDLLQTLVKDLRSARKSWMYRRRTENKNKVSTIYFKEILRKPIEFYLNKYIHYEMDLCNYNYERFCYSGI